MTVHIDYPPVRECKHPEWTYGLICVKCGECGRFNTEFTCTNCGFISENRPIRELKDWGRIEFYDGWCNICPKCKPLFKEEDETQADPWWSAKTIACHIKDFKVRKIITYIGGVEND